MPTQYLVILTILGWGVGSFFYKIANNNIHPLVVSATVTVMCVILTPLAFALLKFDKAINVAGVGCAALGGLCMCAGSIAFFFALKNNAAGQITTATALYPALTLVLSCLFMGEGMTLRKGIGVAFALISVFILSWK